jgi:hypothetical protein
LSTAAAAPQWTKINKYCFILTSVQKKEGLSKKSLFEFLTCAEGTKSLSIAVFGPQAGQKLQNF